MTPARPQAERGFTLLEVMCAFAILAAFTGFLTVVWTQSMREGARALDLRELREAADTIFRRILYEEPNHADGLTGTLDDFYASWANFRGPNRDRWHVYRFELRKELKTAAGPADPSARQSSLFGDQPGATTSRSGTGSSSGGTSGTGSSGSGASGSGTKDDQAIGIPLIKVTVRIWRTEETDSSEPLITLQTYLPSTDRKDARTAGTSTGGGR